MSKTTAFVLGLSLGTALVGCGEDPAPADPGYAADVQPILMAHCVRCHGGGGTLSADPTSLNVMYFKNLPPKQGYFDTYEDRGTCPGLAPACKRGAAYYAAAGKAFMTTWLHPANPADRMPPEPSPALTERELAILDLWLAKSPPKP